MNKEEKEVIKRLKSDIELVTFNGNLNYGVGNLYTNTNDLKILLNLIKKLQKENDNLNKKNKRYGKYLKNKDIEHEKVLEYIETEKERDYISKDKIRTKIKELEEIKNKGDMAQFIAVTEKIKVLNELLGE